MAKIVGDLKARLGLDKSGFDKGIDGAEKKGNKFGDSMKKVGAILASAFALTKIVEFGKQLIEIAGKTEGIKTAFNKLNDPRLLDNLRAATRGTVTDLQLMQKAVQAKNFKIPLDQLATYFEFATKRAIQTGESVDYLVDSIITGIGRKSVLVMDNLGISAIELQEEVKKVGDFGIASGNIIRRELTSMGDVADTTAIKVQSISTAFDNIKAAWGEMLVSGSAFARILDNIATRLNIISDPNLTKKQKWFISPNEYRQWKKDLDEVAKKTGIIMGNKGAFTSSQPFKLFSERGGAAPTAETPKSITESESILDDITRIAGPSKIATENLLNMGFALDEVTIKTSLLLNEYTSFGMAVADTFGGLSDVIAQSFTATGDVLKNFGKFFMDFIKQMIARLVAAAIAAFALAVAISLIPGMGAGMGAKMGKGIAFMDRFKTGFGALSGFGEGFASGGVIPGGYPGDTYPALLSSGERVLTPAQNSQYESGAMKIEVGGRVKVMGSEMWILLNRTFNDRDTNT